MLHACHLFLSNLCATDRNLESSDPVRGLLDMFQNSPAAHVNCFVRYLVQSSRLGRRTKQGRQLNEYNFDRTFRDAGCAADEVQTRNAMHTTPNGVVTGVLSCPSNAFDACLCCAWHARRRKAQSALCHLSTVSSMHQ